MTAVTATAQTPSEGCSAVRAECNNLLNQANDIIKDQDQVIKLQDEQLNSQKSALQMAIEQIDYQKQRADAWYKQPEFTVPLGFVLGIVTAGLIARGLK